MIDPHKEKYHDLYWQMAYVAANQSVATRHQVGAIVVTPTGMISLGWNGMPSGLPNQCENKMVWDNDNHMMRPKTDPRVIHAERNAIDKMTRQGVPTQGSIVFITRAPCLECAKSLCGLGLKAVHYDQPHDVGEGPELLHSMGIDVIWRNRHYRHAKERR